jgi:hypothetical protein
MLLLTFKQTQSNAKMTELQPEIQKIQAKYPNANTNQAEKAAFYARIQDVCNQFKQQNGSIICRELLGLPPGPQDPTPQPRTASYYAHRACADKVKSAADILEVYLKEH